MDNKGNIENKIKQSFDVMDAKVPEGLWGKINDSLSDFDPLANKVKESFEATNNEENIPEGVWDGINQQLNIDKSWLNIKRQLDLRTFYRKSRKYAALLLLLLTFGYGGYKIYTDSEEVEKTAFNQNTPNQNQIVNQVKNENITSEKGGTPNINRSNSTKESEGKTNFELTTKEKNQSTNSIRKPLTNRNPLKLASSTEEKELEILNAVDISEFPKLSLSTSNPGISKMEITLKPITSKKFKKGWEIGIISNLDQTWIFNNETRKSFDNESLISSTPGNHLNFGLISAYNISKKHSVNLLYYNSHKASQSYNTYHRGRYISKSLNFNFRKIALSYQYNFLPGNTQFFDYQFNAKGGVFYSSLKEGLVSQTESQNEVSEQYSNQFGALFQLGQDLIKEPFTISYGFNLEQGFNNLYVGDLYSPADFNKTNNFNIGGYISLKLKI